MDSSVSPWMEGVEGVRGAREAACGGCADVEGMESVESVHGWTVWSPPPCSSGMWRACLEGECMYVEPME